MMIVIPKIAVIGAGAAGLCVTRVINREMDGVNPAVLEAKAFSGGVWRYEEEQEEASSNDNDAGNNPMYRDLKTNRPKELMGYREKPWNGPGDSFVSHQAVQEYLMEYQREFDLEKHIEFSSPVQQLTILDKAKEGHSALSPENESWPRIKLDYGKDGDEKSEIYDAVFVCKGSFTTPAMPEIPGLAEYFDGQVLHSVSYDNPEAFSGQTVLCIGGAASGTDLARDLSQHADRVFLSSPSCKLDDSGNLQSLGKVTSVPRTLKVRDDGSIVFDKDCSLKSGEVDTIIFCSGYRYNFPFINKDSNLEFQCVAGERRVMRKCYAFVWWLGRMLGSAETVHLTPRHLLQSCLKMAALYKQFWHAQHPNLCLIGIPHHIIPFPFFELQAEAAVAQFKSFSLPDKASRLDEANKDSVSGGVKANKCITDTHFLGSFQWDYCRMMAKIGCFYDEDIEAFIATNKV
ncbi:MAG: hypothetical protein SGBAC_009964 [Bacillariaceae sp.]